MGKNKVRGLFVGFSTNEELNKETYDNYYRMLESYVLTMFEWKNLPKSVDERKIELSLITQGHICFFEEKRLDSLLLPKMDTEDRLFLALPSTLGGKINIYGYPTEYNIVTTTGYHAQRNNSNAVIIYNNIQHTGMTQLIRLYAYRLYMIDRTIDTQVKQMRKPTIGIVPKELELTARNFYEQIETNEDFILGIDGLDMNMFNTIPFNIKNETINLNDLKHQILDEFLTFVGLNNANTDKRERLIVNEVDANNEQIYMSREIMLSERKKACEKINRMFGLDIDVEFRYDKEQQYIMELNESQGEEGRDTENVERGE